MNFCIRYDDLRRLFAKYGRIIDVTIPVDYFTRQPKGYCFVEYPFFLFKTKNILI